MIPLFQRNDKPRTLLLERLERRCMLNAHFDCSQVDQDNRIGDSFDAHERLALQRSAQVRNGVGVPIPAGALSQATQPEGQTSRRHHRGDSSTPSNIRLQSSVTVSPAEVVVPLAQSRTTPTTSVVIVFRTNDSVPTSVVPVVPASVSSIDLNAIGSPSSGTSATVQQETQTETEFELREPSSEIAKLQQQELVSFRTVESQPADEIGLTDRNGDLSKIVAPKMPQTQNDLESLDRWLADFADQSDQFSDLDSTLNDLAMADQLRSIGKSSLPHSVESDRHWRVPSVEIDSELKSSSDNMIWLAPFSQVTASCQTTASLQRTGFDSIDDAFAQSTAGVGWYQQFEFVDQAEMERLIQDMSPVVAAAASTSNFVIDAVQPISNERILVLNSRSVSYAVIVAGVASWQVIQRRKRRGI